MSPGAVKQKVQCHLCDSSDLTFITNEVRFGNKADVYRCQKCDLTFLDQASFTMPDNFYESEYHASYMTNVEPQAFKPEVYFEKMKKNRKLWADRMNKLLTGKEVVLDFGCSTGHFMELIKPKAKAVYGSELNKKEIDFCRNTLNLDVSAEQPQKRFHKHFFDYISMIFVLEHMPDPVETLNQLKPLLKPKGKFVIVFINIADPLMSFYDIPEFRNFYYSIEHLFYFNSKTIKKIFDKAGLKGSVELVQEYPLSNHLNWSYNKKPLNFRASRHGIPQIPLVSSAPLGDVQKLWQGFDEEYNKFLIQHGYADRGWCVAG